MIYATSIIVSVLLASFSLLSVSANQTATPPENIQPVGNLLVDRTEVTIADFSVYVATTGAQTNAEINGGGMVYESGWKQMPGWTWKTPFGQKTNQQLPAVHVTFDEAAGYCHWAGKRLPTDSEWQAAAYTEVRAQPAAPFTRGTTYLYPTGDTPDGANCLGDCGTTTAIDFSKYLTRGIGPSPVATSKVGVNGLYDMAANVWEWTETDDDNTKGTRGGSWWYGAAPMHRNHRATKPRDMAAVYIGFRCVRDRG